MYQHVCAWKNRGSVVRLLLVCWLPCACVGPASYDSPEGDDWIAVAAGHHNITCGLHADGVATCWGYDAEHGVDAPTVPLVDIEVGSAVCGLESSGEIVCGSVMNDAFPMEPPRDADGFTALAVGHTQVCGLTADGRVVCEDAATGVSSWSGPPDSHFASICAGRDFNCGILESGQLTCWEREGEERWSAMDGQFADVACGERLLCARSVDGAVSCWENGSPVAGPEGLYAHISAGALSCGVLHSGEPRCNVDDVSRALGVDLPAGSDFEAVAAGTVQVCGLRVGGEIACGEVRYVEM